MTLNCRTLQRGFQLVAVLVGLFASRPGVACSMRGDYQIPTNYELVATSEAIVLAIAPTSNTASFALLEVLKGPFEGELPRLQFGVPFRGVSPEDDFSKARPGAFIGGCIAGDFRPGHRYVLFLEHGKRAWKIYFVAFARVDEEVASTNSPWVAAVRRYVEIANDPDVSHVNAKLRELQKLAEGANDSDARAKYPKGLIADIDRHFATPTPHKSAADLLRLYPKDPRGVLIALSVAHPEDGRELEREILANPHADPDLQSAAMSVALALHDSTAEPFVMRLLNNAGKDPLGKRWRYVRELPQLASAEQEPDVLRVLADSNSTDCEEAAAIGAFWLRFPSEAGHKALAKKCANDFDRCSGVSFLLARMGDKPALDWAIQDVATAHPHWVAGYVLGISPLPEAARTIKALATTAGDDICESIAQGLELAEPKIQAEHGRLLLERARKSPRVGYWLRRELSEAHECDCAELVKGLPETAVPANDEFP